MISDRLHRSAAENKFYDIFSSRYLTTGDPKIVFVLSELIKRVWRNRNGYSEGYYIAGLGKVLDKLVKSEMITGFKIDQKDDRLTVTLTDGFGELIDGSPTVAWSERMLRLPTQCREAYAIGFKTIAGHYGELSIPQIAGWLGYKNMNAKKSVLHKDFWDKPDYQEFSIVKDIDLLTEAGVFKGYKIMHKGRQIYPVDLTNDNFKNCTIIVDADYSHIQQVSDFCKFGGEQNAKSNG